jgi:hypothetical protein
MPKLLVLGKTPQTTALAQVLETCTGEGTQASPVEPRKLTHVGERGRQQRTTWRDEVGRYDIVVALPSLLRQASEALSLVHRLRTDLHWTGRFIAVLRTGRQASRLEEISFVGEAIEGTRFGEVPAHEVLPAPLRLSELLLLLQQTAPSISLEYWRFNLLRSGRAAQLNRQIEKGEQCPGQDSAAVDETLCRDILASLDKIDWGLVASGDGHALKNDARHLHDQYAAKEPLNPGDCAAIIEGAKSVLSRSSFPFPTQK